MENLPQTLDAVMTRLGLSNGDLVKASTEQLTFKMVSKGRAGKQLTPHVQEKIHNALLAARPDLKIRRRDLFRRDAGPELVEAIGQAQAFARSGKGSFPQYVDRLGEAGIHAYTVEVAPHRVVFYAAGGEAYEFQGEAVSSGRPGIFNQDAILAAITASQKKEINYHQFLERIFAAGISNYEVNIRGRKIIYRGDDESYRENIPDAGAVPPQAAPAPAAVSAPKAPSKSAVKRKKKKQKSLTRKARMSANKRWRQKRKAKRMGRRR